MLKYVFLFLFALAPFSLSAQEANDSVIAEAVIKADRVLKTADGLRLYPTARQLESSKDGYGLIARLSLPQIKVNEALQTIEANEMIGTVEVRVNGIVASKQDLMSLDMKSVKSIDYIERPGLVYGSEVGRVINILTRRAESGYVLGGQVMQAFTTPLNNSNLHVRYNRGKQEFSLNYSLSAANWNRQQSTEDAEYILNDNSRQFVIREGKTNCDKRLNHRIAFKYNVAEADKYVVQMTLSGRFDKAPAYDAVQAEQYVGLHSNRIGIHSCSRGITPQADLYFQYTLPHKQSVTVNAVGTYMNQTYDYQYESALPYAYHSSGDQHVLNTELRYQKQWRRMSLAAGGKYDLLSTKDSYVGSIATVNEINRSQYNVYAQMSGSFWEKLNYQAAIGIEGSSYAQNKKKYDYSQIIPAFSLGYNPSRHWSAGYSFKMLQCAPRLALINDITSMRNEMEYVVGNPDIQPHHRFEHTLTANYHDKRVQSSWMALYRTNPDTWMDEISRSADNKFYFKQQNKGDVNMLYISNQTTVQVIPEYWDVTLSASFIRCFNFADTYTHCYSAWMWGASTNAYLGTWSLAASFDNGWRSMEGEVRVRQGSMAYLSASRNLGQWGSVRLVWQNMLGSGIHRGETWLMNQNVRKRRVTYDANLGHMVFSTLSINLSKGKRYESSRKTMDNTDVESSTVVAK